MISSFASVRLCAFVSLIVISHVAATPLSFEAENFLRRHFFDRCHATSGFYNSPVNLDLLFYVFKLVDMDDVEETMSVFATLNLRWSDECVRWDRLLEHPPEDLTESIAKEISNISYIALPSELFWRPAIIHRNSPHNVQAIIENGKGLLTNIFRNGWIEWSPTGTWTTECPLDLKKFPFDVQECKFMLELWDTQFYTNISEANVQLDVENPTGFTTPKMIWTLESLTSEVSKTCFPMGNPPEIYCSGEAHYFVTIKRKLDPYVFSLFIPCVSLILLQISPFAMAPSADRSVYSVTILLAFAVIHGLLQEEIPRTAETIYMVVYINVNIVIGTLCTIYSVISVGLHEKLTQKDGTQKTTIVGKPSFSIFPRTRKVTVISLIENSVFAAIVFTLVICHIVFFYFLKS